MRELLEFFKDIFMINSQEKGHIGLSKFKEKQARIIENEPVLRKRKDLKLSELMRGVN